MKLLLEDDIHGFSSMKIVAEQDGQGHYDFRCKISGNVNKEKLTKLYEKIAYIENMCNELFETLKNE
jgi:hypothetical protein